MTNYSDVNPFVEDIPYRNGLYRARLFKSAHEAFFPVHYHGTDLEVIIPIRMEGEFCWNGRTYTVKSGDVCTAVPETIHSNRFLPVGNGGEHFTLQVNMLRFTDMLTDYTREQKQQFYQSLGSIPPVIADRGSVIRDMLFSLKQIGDTREGPDIRGSVHDFIKDMSIIFSFLKMIAVRGNAVPPNQAQYERVRVILDNIGSHGLGVSSLDELAKKSAISKSHMCALFKQATGRTIQRHILELRVNHAAELMSRKGLNVSEASLLAGFENLSHFVRVFKQYRGVTPKRWSLAQC